MSPNWIFIFGLSGVGKSYTGKLLANQFDYAFYEADQNLTEVMQQAIQNQTPFTQNMRDDFFSRLIQTLKLRSRSSRLIITQGAYKRVNRQALASSFPEMGWLWIQAPWKLITQRLTLSRGLHPVRPEYAKLLEVNFEEPSEETPTLVNDHDDSHILAQFEQLQKNACWNII